MTWLAAPWRQESCVSKTQLNHLLAVAGRTVYATGAFEGWPYRFASAFDSRTGRRTSWQPRPDGEVHAVAADGNSVLLGGQFYGVGGKHRAMLAALNIKTGAVMDWTPAVIGGGVDSLALAGSTLYVGGSFTRASGQPRRGLAAFDLRTRRLSAWYPGKPRGLEGSNYGVQAVVPSGRVVYLGGDFTGIGGQQRFGFAAVDANSGGLLPLAPHLPRRPLPATGAGRRARGAENYSAGRTALCHAA